MAIRVEDIKEDDSVQESIEVLLGEYKLALKVAGKSQDTIDGYMDNLSNYLTFLESSSLMKPVEQLGRKELREYTVYLQNRTRWPNNPHIKQENRSRLSPFTVQAYVRDIKTFWSWLCKEGYIEQNPLEGFPLPKVPETLSKAISTERFETLLSSIDISTPDGVKYYCILLILYDNGMRISELTKIRIADIDFTNKTIKIMGKGRRERLVPIVAITRRQIKRYMDGPRSKICPEDSPYLFADSCGDPIKRNSVQQFMRRLLAKSGLKEIKFSPHILRHSFATQALANGAGIWYVQIILGHKSVTTTMRYTHVSSKDIERQHAQFSPVAYLFRKNS